MSTIRALVIDDSQMMRQLVVFALSRIEGVVCIEADDGLDGMRKLRSDRFDMIFLDINMPIMDGLKLLEVIRKDPSHKSVPVVMLTTEGRPEDIDRAMELGASAYLAKPVQAQAVVDVARDLLKSKS
jgi:two-component system chemotaxis response regulator CheY